MEVYLIDKETNEIITTYNNVFEYGSDYIVIKTADITAKQYCDDDCYFSDKKPEENIDEAEEQPEE